MNSNNTLNHFISAQQPIYPQVLKELRNAKKTTHWMWFIFPQIEGLGHSSTAKYYSIKTPDGYRDKEAQEYVAHPVLGERLLECANIIVGIDGKSANSIFGYPDDMQLRSSMTLFNFVAPEHKVYDEVLKKYFAGVPDEKTIAILKEMNRNANK